MDQSSLYRVSRDLGVDSRHLRTNGDHRKFPQNNMAVLAINPVWNC